MLAYPAKVPGRSRGKLLLIAPNNPSLPSNLFQAPEPDRDQFLPIGVEQFCRHPFLLSADLAARVLPYLFDCDVADDLPKFDRLVEAGDVAVAAGDARYLPCLMGMH
ncbi:MAG: hypothetical protein EOQ28_09225 [Mesorhizobium sp.]|nr:MAG: hypothetical protein EOQ28_09225 [Mesorhizobium sp.]